MQNHIMEYMEGETCLRRPLVVITLIYITGLMAARLLFPLSSRLLALTAVLALGVTVLAVCLLKERPAVVPFLPLIFFAALFNYQTSARSFQGNLSRFAGNNVSLAGRVAAEPVQYYDRTIYLLEAEFVTGETEGERWKHPASGRVRVVAEYGNGESRDELKHYHYGDRLLVKGKLGLPTGPRNPGGFDYNKFMLSQGAGAHLYLSPGRAVLLPPAETSGLLAGIYTWKESTLAFFAENLPRDQASLLGGILFGLRSGLSPEVEENFIAGGAAHLLAVSGLHVGLVAFLALKIMAFARVKEKYRYPVSVLLLFLFLLLTGFKPAGIRAFIMYLLWAGAKALGREGDLPSLLAAAAFLTLILNPFYLFSPGFQLSYAGVFFIFLLAGRFSARLLFFPPALRTMAAVTLAAQVGVAPLTAYYFNQVSLVALFTNLALLPLLSIVMGGGLLAAVAACLWRPLGALILLGVSPFLSLFLAITAAFASLPFAQVRLKSFSLAALLLSYTLITAWVYAGELKNFLSQLKQALRGRGTVLIFCFLLVLTCCFRVTQTKLLEVTFLDVGQGASLFIRTPAGKSIVIDAGGASFEGARDPGESVLVPFLNYRKTKKLNALFITHPHADHYGGAFSLLDSFQPELLGVSVLTGEAGYLTLLAETRQSGIRVLTLAAGDKVRLSKDIELQLLHPSSSLEAGSETAENNNSLVMRLVYGDISFLITGDIGGEAEAFLAKSGGDIKSTVLQVPHHGSAVSTSAAFLALADPQYAVISVGSNPFGHPSEEVLKRLKNRGIAVYRTDLHGAVTFKTDGKKLTVSSMLK